jgi:7,8-dihydropterin-6-yl-methyl-4-(beta-D-ribofuranosyl)aminobenzene 5'-phosphate synthase
MNAMKITVVVDNTVPISAKSPFLAEHGFSLLIEHAGKKILFDAGQSQAVVQNLSLLKVHPAEIDALVLSHGHYDHAGGFYHLVQHGKKQYPLYAHSGIFTMRYSTAGGIRQYIGVPHTKEQLSALGVDWQLGETPREIAPKLWFSGHIPRQTSYEHGDTRLVTCSSDCCDCQDPMEDDISLFYKTDKGLIVVGGCTHSGLVNTVVHGFAVTGTKRLVGWVGGTHLGPVTQQQQEDTMQRMEQWAPEFILAGHCTGFPMMAELSRRFGSKFIPAFVSASIEC